MIRRHHEGVALLPTLIPLVPIAATAVVALLSTLRSSKGEATNRDPAKVGSSEV